MMPLQHMPKAVIAIIALCGPMAMWSSLGTRIDLLYPFLITKFQTAMLPEIREGQAWRLVTPIFIHFGIFHLAMNCAMFFMLGNIVEAMKGARILLFVTLITGIAGNLAQFFLVGPVFGGLSGVVYGVFGYVWMHSLVNTTLRFTLPVQFVAMMLIWFIVCWVGLMPNVANWAHTAGLVSGIILGLIHAKYDVFRVHRRVRDHPDYK